MTGKNNPDHSGATESVTPLVQHRTQLMRTTHGPSMTDITRDCADWLNRIGAREGLLTLFIRHTSASLTIQENADPAVQRDLIAALREFAPEDRSYEHDTEGPDDMPAHIKAMLTSTSLAIPVVTGELALGMWQGVYLVEHRAAPHQRSVLLHYVGAVADA